MKKSRQVSAMERTGGTVQVRSTTLMDVAALIVGREPGSPLVDGLLPLHIFGRVTFNGPERLLFIEDR
jgi:hypothetical protein